MFQLVSSYIYISIFNISQILGRMKSSHTDQYQVMNCDRMWLIFQHIRLQRQ